ncbi:acyl-homoserine-lactone synthase [Pukyongiella litopenaei]|uniref:Acyl-homoserine-lactone synthase n=1 Tax=Pukyongiella litopenaei TaxID=2605946 RepID=A0A5C2H9G8_9RHOB|nr:acyl-homoserine-lactone synthase [Pukyongiella litopenaei]QEP30439.1 hypothetical protein C6Y53_19680 [Pukyongiella litopenaei]
MIDVKVIGFNATDDDRHHLDQYYQLRKSVFIDSMDWSLTDAAGYEFDEYDCLSAAYVVAIDTSCGRVVGGARLLPTTREDYCCPLSEHPSSYMIRDAYLERIDGIPSNLCYMLPPVKDDVWELTRFVSTGTKRVGHHILKKANEYLSHRGASQCLFLGPPSFMRMAKMMGFSPRPLGSLVANEDGSFLAFACKVEPALKVAPTIAVKASASAGKQRAFPVAELFDKAGCCVGIVFRWNTNEEQVRWIDPTSGNVSGTLHRVDLVTIDMPTGKQLSAAAALNQNA